MWKSWLLFLIPAAAAQAADVCNPTQFSGPYAFQLAGSTTISGKPQPTTSLGRLVFDGSGKISGTSSVKFSGLLLGNPVTGTYEAKSDCTLTWQLQDDSGAYQHFRGKLSPDLIRVQFSQTDPGGTRGIMEKTSDSCSSTDLQRKYSYAVAGVTKPMVPDQVGHTVSTEGVLDTARDNVQVDSDCTVHFVLKLQNADATMRGYLVNGGKEILAFQTDPGAMVAARLISESQ